MVVDRDHPFRIKGHRSWARPVEASLGLERLARLLEQCPEPSRECDAVDNFLAYALQVLGGRIRLGNPEALGKVAKAGPLVAVANHPLGGLDGVFLTRMLRRVRPDLKVVVNERLGRIPALKQVFIGVDVLTPRPRRENAAGLRAIFRHLDAGGAVLVFPAGQVSAFHPGSLDVRDRQWNPLVGRLLERFEAQALPIHVSGRNRWWFCLAGLIHPRVRTALLPRALLSGPGPEVTVTVGSPIAWREARLLGSAEATTGYLRTATELLANQTAPAANPEGRSPIATDDALVKSVRARATPGNAALAPYQLLETPDFRVYCTPRAPMGELMNEIAIARERTFRAAGEGTGRAADVDRYDDDYEHLFVLDRRGGDVVGGYRLGVVDQIVATHGVVGLYSRSLYEFDEAYLQRFGCSVELGRSFIVPEFQRHPRVLDLLWRGIGTWVTRHPDYHTLIGCVSISAEHSFIARALLKESLLRNFRVEQAFLGGLTPIAPLEVRRRVWDQRLLASLTDVALINRLVGQCDAGKSIPVLLRKYLSLNGRFIDFSVNHGFNQSLDGLIVVDLRKTPERYLRRYLGNAGSHAFFARWRAERASA